MLIDPEGDFWFGTATGLFRVARREIEAVADGRQPQMSVVTYGRDDGLGSVEFSYGFCNATARTRDGHLWLATRTGALEIVPQNIQRPVTPLPVLIEEIQVNGRAEPLARGASLVLPPRPGLLQIHYTLPQLSSPEKVRFHYRLVGWSDDWLPATSGRVAVFSHLSAGHYRFEVESGTQNYWHPGTVSLAVIVRAAWWETVWCYLGLGLLASLVLAALVRYVVRRRLLARMKRLEQQHALEKERARIARDMHDDVGASLTQIAITSQLAKLDSSEATEGHIDEIAAIARRTVNALDEIVWAVNPRNDTLPALLDYIGQYAVDFLTAGGLGCEVEIPHDLPLSPLGGHVRHHLFMIVKEALNNVVKHAQADAVRLVVEFHSDLLRVIISDNGHGFAEGQERVGSDGQRNMRERMAELGGECQIESIFGKGTCVILQLSLTKQ